jgi:chromosomal replication initiation ATPase DnaA
MSALTAHLSATQTLHKASDLAGVSVAMICGPRASKLLCQIRWAVMAALRSNGMPLTEIGKWLNRDHSTIIYGLRRAEQMQADPSFYQLVKAIA